MKDPSSARNRQIYISRINMVIDYIEKHLEDELTLDRLAGVAHFSPWHFHRLFKYFSGETLKGFIQRLRLEKSASRLLMYPDQSITEIALDSGFSGSSAFARAFKEYFTVTPSEYRTSYVDKKNSKTGIKKSKPGKPFSNIRQDVLFSPGYLDSNTGIETWRISMDKTKEVVVEVKDMPEMEVAYVRHIGPYKGDGALFEELFSRLFRWAIPRGIFKPEESKILSVYHDDPGITEEENLRLSVCITIPPGTKVDGEIGKMTIPGGRFAVGSFELLEDEFEKAWETLMADWLPESGYQPDDRLSYEVCLNDPKEHPENRHIVDICVPVRPL